MSDKDTEKKILTAGKLHKRFPEHGGELWYSYLNWLKGKGCVLPNDWFVLKSLKLI